MTWFKGLTGKAEKSDSPIVVNLYQAPRLPLFRQTFGCAGKYGNVQFYSDNLDAEWQVVDAPMPDLAPLAGKKILYLQNETPDYYLPPAELLKQCAAVLTTIPFDGLGAIPQFFGPPCLMWMYGVRAEMRRGSGHHFHQTGYLPLEDLITAHYPKKSRVCSIIVSNQNFLPGHKVRLEFVARLRKHFGKKIDYFGFGSRAILDKREAIDPYMFSIALENSAYNNYVTEKLIDVYLGYAMPIYYGAPNASDLFARESFFAIDITKPDEAISRIEEIISGPEKFNLDAMKEARRKVLLEYNCFNLVAQVVEELQSREKSS